MDFDKKIFEQACRDYILEVINESKYLREHLLLVEHAKVYDWTKNKATYRQLVSVIISEKTGTKKSDAEKMIKEFEDIVKKDLQSITLEQVGQKVTAALKHPIWKATKFAAKHPIYTAAGLVLGAYLFRKYLSVCGRQCKGNSECIQKCNIDSIKKVMGQLQSQKSQCRQTNNPEKCSKKLDKEIAKWQNKLTKALVKNK